MDRYRLLVEGVTGIGYQLEPHLLQNRVVSFFPGTQKRQSIPASSAKNNQYPPLDFFFIGVIFVTIFLPPFSMYSTVT